jgi:hypothetical protein
VRSGFFFGQIIGIFFISRVLSLILEMIFIKLFKLNKYLGITLSMVVAFVLYQIPGLLLGNVSDIPNTPANIAQREAEVNATNNILMGIALAGWLIVDFIFVTIIGKLRKPSPPSP